LNVIVYVLQYAVVFISIFFQVFFNFVHADILAVECNHGSRNQVILIFLKGCPNGFGLTVQGFVELVLQAFQLFIWYFAVVFLCDGFCFFL